MAESQSGEALILRRNDWRENDSRVVLYTKKFGKLSLVARGAKKFKSKIAGHIEPISLASVMVLKGRAFDYLGSAVTQKSYLNIKNDLNALYFVGQSFSLFDAQVKEGLPDEELFNFLISWLDTVEEKSSTGLSKENGELLFNYFSIRLLVILGYRPELYDCVICQKKIIPGDISFNLRLGGLIDGNCLLEHKLSYLPNELFNISTDAIKMMRFLSESESFVNVKIEPGLLRELNRAVKLIVDFS